MSLSLPAGGHGGHAVGAGLPGILQAFVQQAPAIALLLGPPHNPDAVHQQVARRMHGPSGRTLPASTETISTFSLTFILPPLILQQICDNMCHE